MKEFNLGVSLGEHPYFQPPKCVFKPLTFDLSPRKGIYLFPESIVLNNYIVCEEDRICHQIEWEQYLNDANELLLSRLGNIKDRFICFQEGDCEVVLPALSNAIVFKLSAKKGSNCIAIPYKVVNYPYVNIKKAKYDLTFQGSCLTNPMRLKLKDVFNSISGLKTFFKDIGCYFYQCDPSLIESMKMNYINNIIDSKFVLCPRGGGMNSERFFETLSLGRIPILISDQVKLPLEGLISYDQCVIKIPEKDIFNIEKYIHKFLSNNNLRESSIYSKEIFDNYFSNINTFVDWAFTRF